MNKLPEYRVDLTKDPEDRWSFLRDHVQDIQALFDAHLMDLSALDASLTASLPDLAATLLAGDTIAEIEAVARIADRPREAVYLLNLYYDVFKAIMGCSAFGAAHIDGPVHARNLDWFSAGNVMRKFGAIFHFHAERDSSVPLYSTVGWPGFVGALSGVAAGRFAVTLNAVLSNEPSRPAKPISFLIREVLASAPDFQEAVRRFAETEIAADCLLLVTGARNDEMLIVERTPTRHALRRPASGRQHVIVTNDYKQLDRESVAGAHNDQLTETSCDRYDRLSALLSAGSGTLNADTALALLSDPGVRMDSTMQQMYFQAATGTVVAPRLSS